MEAPRPAFGGQWGWPSLLLTPYRVPLTLCETRVAGPGPVPSPQHSSPVQTEVCEPVLDHNHHVTDREEEGSDLQ